MGRLRALIAAASASAALLVGGASTASAAVVLADGHVDYGARIVAGQLQSQIKDTTQGPSALMWREPSEVVFNLGASAKTTIPSGSKIGFLGPPGTSVWMIPQVQKPGVLWAGWNTEEISSSQVSGGIGWTLDSLEGPGSVAVFQTGSFGDPDVMFNSADGLPDTRSIPLGTHAHGNWSFSQPGEYRLGFTMAAQLAGGGGFTSDSEMLVVKVEADAPGPAGPAPGGGGGSGPGGSNGGTSGGGAGKPAGQTQVLPRLRVDRAELQGRMLHLHLGLDQAASVAATVRRAGRIVATGGPRKVGARRPRVGLRLGTKLAQGRYRVTVAANFGTQIVRRTVALRVGARRG